MRNLPLITLVAVSLGLGACASSSDKVASSGSKAESGKEWWRLSKYSRKPSFKPWVFGDVRQGKGLLGKDDDGFVLYQDKSSGSSDPSKPTKVRR